VSTLRRHTADRFVLVDVLSAGLFTVGHGASSQEQMAALLRQARVRALVDIRRFPGSRAHPHVGADAMAQWLTDAGVTYRWEPRLGGRRRLLKDEPSPDSWWTVEAFRAYAAHTRTPEFNTALDELLEEATERAVAVLCSETVWWRCHRRLVADVTVLGRGVPVTHLLPSGPRPHQPAVGARHVGGGLLVWDGAVSASSRFAES
jgi:uncharacterized protein (DUF488 family)